MVKLACLSLIIFIGSQSFAQSRLNSKVAVVKKIAHCDTISDNLDSNFGKCGRLSPLDSSDLFDYRIHDVIATSNGFYVIYNNWNHKLKVVLYNQNGTVANQFINNIIIDYTWANVEVHADIDSADNLIVITNNLFGDDSSGNFKLTKILKSGVIKYSKYLSELRYSNSFSLTVNKQNGNVYVINRLDDYTTRIFAFDKNGNHIMSFGENGKIIIDHNLNSGNPSNFYWSEQTKNLKFFAERTIFSINDYGNVVSKYHLKEYPILQTYENTIFNDDGILSSGLLRSGQYVITGIFKVLPSGFLDQSFASNGVFNLDKIGISYNKGSGAIKIYIDNNKLIYATYLAQDFKTGLIRLSQNGVLDDSFAGQNLPAFFFNSEDEGTLERIIFLSNNSPILLLQKGSPNYESAIYKLKIK